MAAWTIYTHQDLVPQQLLANQFHLLCEGSWHNRNPQCFSLDESINGQFAWIDSMALEMADQVARSAPPTETNASSNDYYRSSPEQVAHWNQLALRYAFIKWLRVVAFFSQVKPVGPFDRLSLHAQRGRDEDYIELLRAIAQANHTRVHVCWHPAASPSAPAPQQSAWWRNAAAWLNRQWDAVVDCCFSAGKKPSRPTAALLGRPELLDPVCRELSRRGWNVVWLWEDFHVGCARSWRLRGVRQRNRLAIEPPQKLKFAPETVGSVGVLGVDFTKVLSAWLAQQPKEKLDRQANWAAWVQQQMSGLRPDILLLDEDASPRQRIAIDAAGQVGCRSVVLQHGVPYLSVGYAPLHADWMCVWGGTSRDRLASWGVPAERLIETGSPKHDAVVSQVAQSPLQPPHSVGPHLVLLATTAPKDHRPDPASFHYTAQTARGMWEAVFSALSVWPEAELTIKTHPRCPHPPELEQAAGKYPQVRYRVVQGGSLFKLLSKADCVLSFASTAGIEAVLLGLPVIEIVPQGGHDPQWNAGEWGLIARVSSGEALQHHLREVFLPDQPQEQTLRLLASPRVFANRGQTASACVADSLEQLLFHPQTRPMPGLAMHELKLHQPMRPWNSQETEPNPASLQVVQEDFQEIEPTPALEAEEEPSEELSSSEEVSTWIEFEKRCQKPQHKVVGNWLARRVTRPLALRLTWLLIPTGVSANQITLLALGYAAASVYCFGWGTMTGWLLGAMLLHIWYLLDHVDGQLARYYETASLDGTALDYLMHHLVNTALPLGVGYGLFCNSGWQLCLGLGLGWSLGSLALGLLNDTRYKAFIQRLKRLEGTLHVLGGGAGRPKPPAGWPAGWFARLKWCLRKSSEIHVQLLVLPALAAVQWVGNWHSLWPAACWLAAMALIHPMLAIASWFKATRSKAAEQEFKAWYQVPEGFALTYRDGFWSLELVASSSITALELGQLIEKTERQIA